MVRKIFFICALLLSISSFASARPYFSLGGMYVFLEDADLSGPLLSTEVKYDDGWGAFAAAGYQFDFFRLEGEAAYRRNDIDDIAELEVDGKTEAMSAMLNGYLDFAKLPFRPFIGVGAGAARVEADLDEVGDEHDTVFAYQGIAGLSFGELPLGFDVGYRYFATEDPEFDRFESEYKSHNIYLAIRF